MKKNYRNSFFKPVMLLLLALSIHSMVSCVDIPKPEDTTYDTMKVKLENKTVDYMYSAKLQGKQDVSILPQVTGTITRIAVKEGQVVKSGQLLFVIDTQQYELNVQTAAANVASAKATLATAKLNYESNNELYKQGIVSSYVMETALNNYKTAQASLGMAQAQEAQTRVDLARCFVKSPVSGLVGSIKYRVGDLVNPSMIEPLTIISDNSFVDAYFSITEADFTAIAMALDKNIANNIDQIFALLPPVHLRLKDGTLYSYEGKVETVSGLVDVNTGSISCKAKFPNPKGTLRSGISGTVVYSETIPNIMCIPQTAINRLQNKSLVYVVQPDTTVKATIVEVQELNDGKIFAVTKGLKLGERIVTVGANNLTDGQKIKIGE